MNSYCKAMLYLRCVLLVCFHCRVLSGRRCLIVDNHRTAKYTMLLPFGRDTVHFLYGVMKSLTSPR